MIDVRLRLSEADLLDAGEDIGRLLEEEDDLAVSPPFRDVLLALDDALTVAVVEGARSSSEGATRAG